MIDLYKRYIFWNLRMTGKIPGLKRYSAWLTKHYTNHFWRTNIIIVVLSTAFNLAANRIFFAWATGQATKDTDVRFSTLPSTADYRDPHTCATEGCDRHALKSEPFCFTCKTNIAATLNNPT